MRVEITPAVLEHFWAKVEKSESCWLWTGAKNERGYGGFTIKRAGVKITIKAHRFAYEVLVGPIPDGLVLDHLCETPLCVKPQHLEPVSNAENKRRARSLYCRNGHLLTGENLEVNPVTGDRRCRRCRLDYMKKWTEEREQENPHLRESRLAYHRAYNQAH